MQQETFDPPLSPRKNMPPLRVGESYRCKVRNRLNREKKIAHIEKARKAIRMSVSLSESYHPFAPATPSKVTASGKKSDRNRQQARNATERAKRKGFIYQTTDRHDACKKESAMDNRAAERRAMQCDSGQRMHATRRQSQCVSCSSASRAPSYTAPRQ